MGTESDRWLDEVRGQIAPTDETIATARTRRDEVLAHAAEFPGVLRGYSSGSIAHHTANDDTDADCGIVLDRRVYTELGPDGGGLGPNDVIESMRVHLRERMQQAHPAIAFRVTRRAIRITYNEPSGTGVDSIVELIVALTRENGALWIPNKARNGWDASDPEKHTELLLAGPIGLRRIRRLATRLGKGWNKQYVEPGLCSFNLEALSLLAIQDAEPLTKALLRLFDYSATDLEQRLTPDPAGVSKPIKVLLERDIVVDRLRHGADLLQQALDAEDEGDAAGVQTALGDLFWKYIEPPATATSRAAFANTLREGNGGVRVSGGLALGSLGIALKTTRAFGERSR